MSAVFGKCEQKKKIKYHRESWTCWVPLSPSSHCLPTLVLSLFPIFELWVLCCSHFGCNFKKKRNIIWNLDYSQQRITRTSREQNKHWLNEFICVLKIIKNISYFVHQWNHYSTEEENQNLNWLFAMIVSRIGGFSA